MPLTRGTRLGVYDITAPIGEGGMGQVYRAMDTTLGRQVAIKILPDAFAADPERMARFEREAKTLASLNHPHIAAIYGFEKSAGLHALVMELVEGDDLSQRIARGAIPIDEALPIAKQIAEALETAHEQGIIHRDLKPANIKVRADGTVKVLDFGLAKAMTPAAGVSPNLSMSPTIMSPALLSGVGVILGTAAYMAPEQARGKTVDKRADVWAFGCVLFEMLTGTRAFGGEDTAETIGAVIHKEPVWNRLPPQTPERVRTVLERCLDKDPRRRVRDIGDVELALEGAFDARPSVHGSEPPGATRLRTRVGLAGAALLTFILGGSIVGLAVWIMTPLSPAPLVSRFTFTLGAGQALANSGRTGTGGVLAFSRDGAQIVYVANSRLYVRRIGELEPTLIPGTESQRGVLNPVFSPDGGSIVFHSSEDGTLKRMAVSGGAASTLCPVATAPFGLDWNETGILFGQSGGIMRVSANGSTPETLITVKSDEIASTPQMLPGAKAVLFTLALGPIPDWAKAQIFVQSLGSGERKVLIAGGSDAHYVPSGHLVYALSGTLRAVPFNLRRLEVTGSPVVVIEGVARSLNSGDSGTAQFSYSNNGSLAYVPRPVTTSPSTVALALVDRLGRSEPLKLPSGQYGVPRVAPDGRQLAFHTSNATESIIWIHDLSGATPVRRLTFGGKNLYPVWSPDSQWIAFQSDREGDRAIFQQRADGTGTAERLTRPEADTSHVPDAWSPNGQTLLFEVKKRTSASLWALSLRDKKASEFGNIQTNLAIAAAFAPDGRWVAYTSEQDGGVGVYVQPYPATGAKYQMPQRAALGPTGSPDHAPVFSRDGKELIYALGPRRFAAVRITTHPVFAAADPVEVFAGATNNALAFQRGYDLMPDGQHILTTTSADPEPGTVSRVQFHIVLNWFEELRQRVPAK